MKGFTGFALVIVIVIFISCKHNSISNADVGKWVMGIADVECKAISLREQRFALANEIRFAQDTLMQTKDKTDTVRLSNKIAKLTKQKESILNQSLAIADSIKSQLDTLKSNHFTDTSITRIFNDALNDTLKKRGCLPR